MKPGSTVAVVGDGAVGLLGVLSAKQMGAERIIAMSRHPSRQELARELGATDVVSDLVWNRQIAPGRVFDLVLPLDQVAEGYRAKDERRAIKALLRP